MIRFLVGGIVRILIWFFAFYLVSHLVRGIIHAFFPQPGAQPSRAQRPVAPPSVDGEVGGNPPASTERYIDVQDAKFSDVTSPK